MALPLVVYSSETNIFELKMPKTVPKQTANEKRLAHIFKQRRAQGLCAKGSVAAAFKLARMSRDWAEIRNLIDLNLPAPKKLYKQLPPGECLTCGQHTPRNFCSIDCWNKVFEDNEEPKQQVFCLDMHLLTELADRLL